MANQASATRQVEKALRDLTLFGGFWSHFILGSPVRMTDLVETCAVDGAMLYCNPEWVSQQGHGKLIVVMAHEAAHNADHHMLRRGSRDPDEWNTSCDYSINGNLLRWINHLKRSGTVELPVPEDWLYDAEYDGWSPEKIYADREQKGNPPPRRTQPGDGGGGDGEQVNDPGGMGAVVDATNEEGEALTETEVKQAIEDAKAKVSMAINNSRAAGNMPAELLDAYEELVTPKVDWESQLWDWVELHTPNPEDYKLGKVSSFWLSCADMYLPGLAGKTMGELVWATDLSGSVSDDEAIAFHSERKGIMDQLQPEKAHVLFFNHKIMGAHTIENGNDDLPNYRTGGGTNFACVFDWVRDNKIEPKGMIFLTDLGASYPSEPPPYPVLWVKVGNYDNPPPFGDVIELEV